MRSSGAAPAGGLQRRREDAGRGGGERDSPTWDILICSIEQRTAQLHALLAELARQQQPGVGVLVYRDNLEARYGEKCQALLELSQAEYVSFVDDDDWIHHDYVALIMEALQMRPDYVGFRVKITDDGESQRPAVHSLAYGVWTEDEHARYRGISHLNPIRRELALLGDFATAATVVQLAGASAPRHELASYGCDRVWAEQVRLSGRCLREVFLDGELYHYQHSTSNDFFHARALEQAERIPHPPGFGPFVTWLEPWTI